MDKTSEVGKLNAFGTSAGKSEIHLRVQRDKKLYYLCTLSIRNFSSIQKFSSRGFELYQSGFRCSVYLSVNQEEVKTTVLYNYKNCGIYKRGFTILTDGGIVLFHNTLKDRISHSGSQEDIMSLTGDDLKKLKELPNDTFVLTYRIIRGVDELILKNICNNTAISNSEYLKLLEADLKNVSSDILNQKVSLCVGSEAEVVNKAVLYVRSPVFARMFDSDMRESKSNTVTITDIKMPVVRALVSFLCSGLLSDCDFDLLCDLYYAANKYDIWELHQACVRLLLDKVTCGNVTRVLKLSVLHNDEMLKSAAMTLISANTESVALARDWKDLMCDDPVLALKASTFFDF